MRFSRIIGFAVFVGFVLSGCASQKAKQPSKVQPIRVMSFNIRYATPADGINRWNNRKKRVINFIRFYDPDFLGTQEVLHRQLVYLQKNLPNYKHIGVGRKDGEKAGEYSALFYNAKRFQLVEGTQQTIWLSKMPYKPSKSWDAALPRILTFGQFKDRRNGKTYWVFNTHFDHRGEIARQKSARIILKKIKEVSNGQPVILMGDFNVTEKDKPYQIITSSNSPLKDAFYASKLPPVGPYFTFEGFAVNSDDADKPRIDYIFVNERWEVQEYAALPTYRNGYHLSDHLPILAVLTLASEK